MTEFEGGTGTVRSVIGAIMAPLGAILLYVVWILASNLHRQIPPPWALSFFIGQILHSTFLNPLLLIEVYAFELLIGLPVHLQLQRHGTTSLGAVDV